MGCGSTQLRLDGQIIKQEIIELDINNHYKNKELLQAQHLIHLITNLRNKIIYEYDNLIYTTGACLFKNPTITHCTRCILFKISSECKGDLGNAQFTFREDPPFLKVDFDKFSEETNKLLNQLFDFIIKLRDYKIIMKQIDKETPKLMYIVFENNNKISKENLNKINKSISLFKDLYKLRNNLLVEYKNQIYELLMHNENYLKIINEIGKTAYESKITDIYEITMLFKKISFNENESLFFIKEDWIMNSSINEAKRTMEKKLENEKVEDIDTSLLTFSVNRAINCDTFQEIKNKNNTPS